MHLQFIWPKLVIPEVVVAAAEGCLLATSKQLPNNNSSSQNSNRTIEHCWTVAEFCLCCVFFLSLLFFGQEPFSLSWTVQSCPSRLTRHRVWLSSRICGICAESRGPALWAHSSGTLCRIMRCRRLLCLSFAVWLLGCRGDMVYTCSLQLCSYCCCCCFFIRIVTGSANDRRMHRYKSIYNCAELWLSL